MTDLDFKDLPNQDQILVTGKDADGNKILVYIPKHSTETEMFRTKSYYYHEEHGISLEEYYDLDFTQIIDITDEDGDNFGLYLIIGILNADDYETHVFFGFITEYSDNKYIIDDVCCFSSFSICNRDIQQPECLKFLGNFTWAICLKDEIRFIQIKQNLLDAFADSRTGRYMPIIRSGVIFDTKSIDFGSIHHMIHHTSPYSIVDSKSPYSIVNYGNEIVVQKKIKTNCSAWPNTFGQLRIKIVLDKKELPLCFRWSFNVYKEEHEDNSIYTLEELLYERTDVMRFNEK